MDERVIAWSHGRRLRIIVTDVPGDYERLLEVVTADAGRTDDRERLADDVSALFHKERPRKAGRASAGQVAWGGGTWISHNPSVLSSE